MQFPWTCATVWKIHSKAFSVMLRLLSEYDRNVLLVFAFFYISWLSKSRKKTTNQLVKPVNISPLPHFFFFTWNVGCYIDCSCWSKSLNSTRTYKELISSPRMQVWKDVVRAVPQLWHSLWRSCNWNCRIKWPYTAVADLWKRLFLKFCYSFQHKGIKLARQKGNRGRMFI